MSSRLVLAVILILAVAALVFGRLSSQELDKYSYLPVVLGGAVPTVPPDTAPVIHYFRANVAVADPGDTIQLEWSTTHAISITLYHLMPSGQFGSWWEVEPAGVFTYTIPTSARNRTDFMLFAGNEHSWTSASVSIPLTCPDPWFFSPAPDECPSSAAVVSAGAEQRFERGTMIWIQAQDLIYVLFDDDVFSPKWYPYLDEWEEGDPIDDPTIIPPPGYYQPSRGFGLVWREQPNVRERLGWAIDTEAGYETAVQHTSRSKYDDTYIRAHDGHVWRLLPEFSGWEKIVTDG